MMGPVYYSPPICTACFLLVGSHGMGPPRQETPNLGKPEIYIWAPSSDNLEHR